MAHIIDGKLISEEIREELKVKIENLKAKTGLVPCLAVVIVGENPASQVYVKNKEKACEKTGIKSVKYELPSTVSEKELLILIEQLNSDEQVHGILVQLPLPKHINEEAVISAISSKKDADGFHLINVGKLSIGQTEGIDGATIPCTPNGCLHLIKSTLGNDLSGKKVTVIGRSNIVGKPVAALLLKENCTVKIVHSRTHSIEEECKWADIIVCAVGKPFMLKKDMVHSGTVVIDVGINRIEVGDKTQIVGDADFEGIKDIVQAITPVPGGVGPMTIAYLLQNTYELCLKQNDMLEYL